MNKKLPRYLKLFASTLLLFILFYIQAITSVAILSYFLLAIGLYTAYKFSKGFGFRINRISYRVFGTTQPEWWSFHLPLIQPSEVKKHERIHLLVLTMLIIFFGFYTINIKP